MLHSLIGCVLRRNGRIQYTGAGAAVLGSPLHAATWLANTLTRRGVELAAGHVILTGSLTAAVPVRLRAKLISGPDRSFHCEWRIFRRSCTAETKPRRLSGDNWSGAWEEIGGYRWNDEC